MRVSVVMAAHDAAAHIGDAVGSVLAQTHADWELVVVDDGSRDDTVRRVEAFRDPRIRVLQREHCGVLAQVRNAGIRDAGGAVVALLDADDMWLPRKLEWQLQALDDDVGVVHTWADLLVGGERRPGPRPKLRGPLLRAILRNNFIFSSSVLVRREVLLFDEDPALGGSLDYALWLRLASRTRFVLVEEPLLLYRVHPGQMSARSREIQESALVAIEKFSRMDPAAAQRERADVLLARGMRLQLAHGSGRRELLRSLVLRPWSLAAWRWLARSFVAQRPA